MSLNAATVLTELKTVLEGVTGISTVQIGAPLSLGPTVTAYVTLGSISMVRATTGTTQRRARYWCCLCYRVDQNEPTVESTLAGMVDEFLNALYADLTLNGTVTSLEANSLVADEPDYQQRAGKEYREYPIVVEVTQRGTYTVNP